MIEKLPNEIEGDESVVQLLLWDKLDDLIDLVNSQQEAIGELQTEIGVLRNMVLQSQEAIEKLEKWLDNELADQIDRLETGVEKLQAEKIGYDDPLPADDKPEYEYGNSITKVKLDGTVLTVPDTHRTITLRIPKGMRVGEAIDYTMQSNNRHCRHQSLSAISDTYLQKALDEVKGESNE